MTDAKKIFKTYGMALRYERKRYKINQGELAKRMGINQSEISRWENSDAVPLDHNQERIKQVLNIVIAPVKDGWVIKPVEDSQKTIKEPLKLYSSQIEKDTMKRIDQLIALASEGSGDTLRDPLLLMFQDQVKSHISAFESQLASLRSTERILDALLKKK